MICIKAKFPLNWNNKTSSQPKIRKLNAKMK